MQAAAAVVATAVAVLATAAAAGNPTFDVHAVVLTHSIHLHADYYIGRPGGCPEFEPDVESSTFDEDFAAWTSPECAPYAGQDADLILRIYRNGRVVYSEDEHGRGDVIYGGSWDGYAYQFLFAHGCGGYRWRLTYLDPFDPARNTARTGAFRLRC